MQRMIDMDAIKGAIVWMVSITSTAIGTFSNKIVDMGFLPVKIETGAIDILLQRGAWTIGIIAGIVSVCYSIKNNRKKKKNVPD